jgi:hypothetical protein
VSDFPIYDDSEEPPDDVQIYQPAPVHAPTPRAAPSVGRAPASSGSTSRHAPAYADITRGAGVLRVIAGILNIFAVLSFLGGLWLAITAMNEIGQGLQRGSTSPVVPAIILAVSIWNAVVLFAVAAFLKFVAGTGEAIRDTARNSFK